MYCCFVCYTLVVFSYSVFFFKQKTAYEMRISDWSSDVCSSDLVVPRQDHLAVADAEEATDRDHQPLHLAGLVQQQFVHRTDPLIRGIGDIGADRKSVV